MCGKKRSSYDLILSKQTVFDEKNSAKQKGTKQVNIDRKLRSHVTAVTAVFINSSKIISCKNYLTIILLPISSFPTQ